MTGGWSRLPMSRHAETSSACDRTNRGPAGGPNDMDSVCRIRSNGTCALAGPAWTSSKAMQATRTEVVRRMATRLARIEQRSAVLGYRAPVMEPFAIIALGFVLGVRHA